MLIRALTTIRRSPYQAVTALLMIAVTSFVAYSLTTFLYGAEKLLQHFEKAPEVIAFFELDTDPSIIKNVQQSIEQKTYVTETTLITQEQALDLYRSQSDNNPLLLELVTADFLPASLEVSGESVGSLKQIAEDLASSPGIEEVQFQADVVDQLDSWITNLRLTGLAILAVLGLMSFLTIGIIIALKATSKKHTIQIMRVVGATRWYIASPYMMEGALYGFFGSLLGFGAMQAMLLYLMPELTTFLADVPVLPIPIEHFAIQLAAGTLCCIVFGSLAARAAVGRMIQQ